MELFPCKEESVDWENTQNMFIEGDNLDALKLLRKDYLGKVKMIYIDPPYNTGQKLIYNDNFKGHHRWLNMMFPRLFLARDLLKDDGVIFISIDDHEVANLRKICDEIFGEENFEGHIHWRRRRNQPNNPTKMIGLVAEHIISYSKDKIIFKQSGIGKIELTGKFINPDNDSRGDWASKPWKVGSDQSGSKYTITLPSGEVAFGEWMGAASTFKSLLDDKRIIFPNNGKGLPRKKYYKSEREEAGQSATNWWNHEQFGNNQEANQIMSELMGGIKNIFSNPKPPKLIKNLCRITNIKSNHIILDFFAGSCTTAHAVLNLNKEDNGNCKFIMVQLPELTNGKSEAFKAGYKNIADIGKERIRRVISKIQKDDPEYKGDLGFKVFKLKPRTEVTIKEIPPH